MIKRKKRSRQTCEYNFLVPLYDSLSLSLLDFGFRVEEKIWRKRKAVHNVSYSVFVVANKENLYERVIVCFVNSIAAGKKK